MCLLLTIGVLVITATIAYHGSLSVRRFRKISAPSGVAIEWHQRLKDFDATGYFGSAATEKAESVRQAFKASWDAYSSYAYGFDELKPLSFHGVNNMGGMGVTLVDNLDALSLMGFKEELSRAIDWVVTDLNFSNNTALVSMFELNIRVIGGLLSGYELTQETRLLDKAAELAARFLPAFGTATGLPVNWQRMPLASPRATDTVALADVGSFTLEWAALAHSIQMRQLQPASRRSLLAQVAEDNQLEEAAVLTAAALVAQHTEILTPHVQPAGTGPLSQLPHHENLPSAEQLVQQVYAASTRLTDAAEGIVNLLLKTFPDRGLLPSELFQLKPDAAPSNLMYLMSMGAPSDSMYEYLLKLWIYRGKANEYEAYRLAWERAADEALSKLYFTGPNSGEDGTVAGYLGVLHADAPHLVPRQEHLACFFPGNLVLGVMHGAVNGSKAEHYIAAAKNLTAGCWNMYASSPTGLAAEAVMLHQEIQFVPVQPQNFLRPETVESLFYLWRYTKDPMYRAQGWSIFQAFETYSKIAESGAYSGITTTFAGTEVEHDNSMPSFWMSETLKYLWLLFSEDDVLDLHTSVLTTEAHPLRIPF